MYSWNDTSSPTSSFSSSFEEASLQTTPALRTPTFALSRLLVKINISVSSLIHLTNSQFFPFFLESNFRVADSKRGVGVGRRQGSRRRRDRRPPRSPPPPNRWRKKRSHSRARPRVLPWSLCWQVSARYSCWSTSQLAYICTARSRRRRWRGQGWRGGRARRKGNRTGTRTIMGSLVTRATANRTWTTW